MRIIGIEKSSFIDYPGKISTVYFTAGCNFRCPYCHNAHIVEGLGKEIKEEEILEFINKRKKFIDAVCISGGEPTLQNDLYDFIKKIKKMGFHVKLDTNGSNPGILKKLIDESLIDYVAMDIKAPLEDYERVVNVKVAIQDIIKSIEIIRTGGIDYEFRTTVCRELLSEEDIIALAESIKGSKRYIMQNFRDGDTVLAGPKKLTPYDMGVLGEVKKQIEGWFEICKVR